MQSARVCSHHLTQGVTPLPCIVNSRTSWIRHKTEGQNLGRDLRRGAPHHSRTRVCTPHIPGGTPPLKNSGLHPTHSRTLFTLVTPGPHGTFISLPLPSYSRHFRTNARTLRKRSACPVDARMHKQRTHARTHVPQLLRADIWSFANGNPSKIGNVLQSELILLASSTFSVSKYWKPPRHAPHWGTWRGRPSGGRTGGDPRRLAQNPHGNMGECRQREPTVGRSVEDQL